MAKFSLSMDTKSYISITCGPKKRSAKKKSSKKVGTLTIETAVKRPDLAYLSPEMVMPYINSSAEKTISRIFQNTLATN
jgi:hypothetical protein